MKKYISILALLVMILSFACRKKCESVKTGAVALNEVSKTYTPYEDGETLTFVNEQGDEMLFTNERVAEDYRICVKYLCKNTSDPFQQTPCEYYEAEGFRNLLRTTTNDTLLIELIVSTENYESESTLFYDIFSIHLSKIGPLARGQYVPYVGFADPVFDETNTYISEPMTEVDEIELMGKTYTDVIYTTDADNQTLYLQKGKGLVVIRLDGILWGLEE